MGFYLKDNAARGLHFLVNPDRIGFAAATGRGTDIQYPFPLPKWK